MTTTYARPRPPPINALPIELLSYIFVLSTHYTTDEAGSDDGNDPTPSFTAESVKAPLLLASVSQYWRRVALNTPRLWSSLCITMQMIHPVEDDDNSSSASIDVRHITSYLALSRKYPIDILVDARDYEWDFLEDDVNWTETDPYITPFSGSHMKTVFDLLLPHLHRWRTLSILTDTWKPMHTVLETINTPLLTQGAPLLESLTLMRCNDFISFSSEFQPASLKDPLFLSNPKAPSFGQSNNILPRLKHLSLRGVHVDWTSLGAALSSSETGLASLELGSHCADVRPTLSEFHRLLTSNPSLRKLIVSGSGPLLPLEHADNAYPHQDSERASLAYLTHLTVGYRSAAEGAAILKMIDAPGLRRMVLEEATYPADADEIDAGGILTYLGTGEFESAKEQYLSASSLDVQAVGYQAKPRKDSTSSIASTSTYVGSSIEIDGRLYDDDDDETLVDFDTKLHPPFPQLEDVTLKGVKTSSTSPLASFLWSLNRVQRLELSDMSMKAVQCLLPDHSNGKPSQYVLPNQPSTSSGPASSWSCTPCPQLQSLSLRDFELHGRDIDFIVNRLVPERRDKEMTRLESIDIQLMPTTPAFSCPVVLKDGSTWTIGEALERKDSVGFDAAGVSVNFLLKETHLSYEDDDDWEMEATAYA